MVDVSEEAKQLKKQEADLTLEEQSRLMQEKLGMKQASRSTLLQNKNKKKQQFDSGKHFSQVAKTSQDKTEGEEAENTKT